MGGTHTYFAKYSYTYTIYTYRKEKNICVHITTDSHYNMLCYAWSVSGVSVLQREHSLGKESVGQGRYQHYKQISAVLITILNLLKHNCYLRIINMKTYSSVRGARGRWRCSQLPLLKIMMWNCLISLGSCTFLSNLSHFIWQLLKIFYKLILSATDTLSFIYFPVNINKINFIFKIAVWESL